MDEKNTYKEHHHYNGKERNLKNIAFDPQQPFESCLNFMDTRQTNNPHYFFDPRINLMVTR